MIAKAMPSLLRLPLCCQGSKMEVIRKNIPLDGYFFSLNILFRFLYPLYSLDLVFYIFCLNGWEFVEQTVSSTWFLVG